MVLLFLLFTQASYVCNSSSVPFKTQREGEVGRGETDRRRQRQREIERWSERDGERQRQRTRKEKLINVKPK